MRKDSLLTLTALALVLTLGGCSKDDNAGTDNDGIIRFGVSEFPESRAAINSADAFKPGDAFDVWGYYTSPTAGKIDVFKGENGSGIPVTKSDAGWSYNGGDRYWVKEMPYTFYAVYPSKLGKLEDGNTITVDKFDCSKTGAEAVDLMTASKTGIIYQANETPQPVALKFSHELARLRFTVKSENSSLTVTSFSVYGVNYAGNFEKTTTNTHWTDLTLCTSADDTPYQTTGHLELNTTDGLERNIFGDVLLPPHETLDNARLRITYRFPGETTDRESVINLKIPGKTEAWTAGESYGYTLTIKGGSLSVTVKINPWDEKDTSVSWG